MGWQTLRVTEAATFFCKQLPQRSTHNVSHVGMTNGVPIWAVDVPAALIHTPATFHVPHNCLIVTPPAEIMQWSEGGDITSGKHMSAFLVTG